MRKRTASKKVVKIYEEEEELDPIVPAMCQHALFWKTPNVALNR